MEKKDKLEVLEFELGKQRLQLTKDGIRHSLFTLTLDSVSKKDSEEIAHRYNSHAGLVEALEIAMGLLNATGCPQCDGSVAYYGCYNEPTQCQWCYEKHSIAEALAAVKKGK